MFTSSTNMHIQHQRRIVNGPKFHEGLLKKLHLEDEADKLPASALATYILLYFKVSPIGLLPNDFTISSLSQEANIPYSTLYSGFQICLDRQLVKEVFVDEKSVYEITDYAFHNRTKEEGNLTFERLSYFRIPTKLLDSGILAALIKSKDRLGIYYLLKLCKSFTRDIGRWDKDSTTRRMDTLKIELRRTAKRVREYVQLLSPVFQFTAKGAAVKDGSKNARNRIAHIREAIVQIVIPKFSVQISSSCLIENEQPDVKSITAKMTKDAHARVHHMGLSMKKKDTQDLSIVFRDEIVKFTKYIDDVEVRKNLLTFTMTDALDQLENYKRKTNKKIREIGALMRTYLRNSIEKWTKEYLSTPENDRVKHEFQTNYYIAHKDYPKFLNALL